MLPSLDRLSNRYGLPSISRDDKSYNDQDYWTGRIWAPMVQLVYWGLEQYNSSVVRDATRGLVAQSKDLLMKNWYGYPGNGGNGSFAGVGRNVMENYGADSGEGYEASSSATPFYSWCARLPSWAPAQPSDTDLRAGFDQQMFLFHHVPTHDPIPPTRSQSIMHQHMPPAPTCPSTNRCHHAPTSDPGVGTR
jgi:hypothetical protein